MEINVTQLRQVFFQDAEEHLERIDNALAQMSADGDQSEAIGSLFRSVHSLKGDSGALGFETVELLLHRFETYLESLRTGELSLSDGSLDAFSIVVGCLEQLLTAARDEGPSPEGLADVYRLLDDLQSAKDVAPAKADAEDVSSHFGLFEDEPAAGAVQESPDGSDESCQPVERCHFGEFLVARELVTQDQLDQALTTQREGRPQLGAVLLKSGALSMKDVEKVLATQRDEGNLFGQTAVALGLLEEEALEEALAVQKKSRPGLRKTLMQLGILDRATVQQAFREFSGGDNASNGKIADPPPEIETQPAASSDSKAAFDCDPELLAEFISDSDEHLTTAEEQLLVIEGDPGNAEALNAIYRAFHTVKGLSSFLGLEEARNLAHQAESMLNMARDGQLKLSGDTFEVALASIDGLRLQVRFAENWLRTGGSLGADPELPRLLTAIQAVTSGSTSVDTAAISKKRASDTEVAEQHPPASSSMSSSASRGAAPTQVKETIKVDRDRLDKLINVIGELVIGQAMVEQEIADWQLATSNESFAISQLNKTVRDLQELSLSLRMVPVGSVFNKMARIVRDLGRKLDKEIVFRTEGDDTELDKTVVDQIGDPLLHMVRNAADHGIETKEDRLAAGKPAHGTVVLRAYHQGGNIYLEITDDGKGLDSEALLRKAIERGIVAEGESLTEAEIQNLIFAPGFSTAKQVTDVSGRGVGMDVVRRNVESLQGSVSVQSTKGLGSTITIRLPLTLAILDGLSIRLGDDVYIVPILSVVESFSPAPGDVKKVGGKGEVVVVRGEVVPLLRLERLLGCPSRTKRQRPDEPLVVIVEDRGKKYALLVDELLGQSQVVIKNLETNYQKVEGLAGATILGDGRVAMILDVFGLVSLAATRSHSACEETIDAAPEKASVSN